MMRLLYSVMLLFAPLCLLAQLADYTLSDPIEVNQFRTVQKHLYSDASGHYVTFSEPRLKMSSEQPSVVIFEKYSPDFELLFSKRLESDKKGVKYLDLHYHNQHFVRLSRYRGKKAKTSRYDLHIFDKTGTETSTVQLATIEEKKAMKNPKANWCFSPDSSKMLLAVEVGNKSKKLTYQAYLAVFNTKYEQVWQKTLQLKEKKQQIKTLDWTVDNEGNVHYLLKKYDTPKAREVKSTKINKQKEAAYGIYLGGISAQLESPLIEVYDTDKFVLSTKLAQSPWGSVFVAGMLSDEPYSRPIDEVFYAKFTGVYPSADYWILRPFVQPDLELLGARNIKKYYDESTPKVGLKKGFSIRSIEFNEGYLSTIVTERERMDEQYIYSSDIVLLPVDNVGEMQKIRVIPKEQRTNKAQKVGYSIFNSYDRLYFLYNDNIANLRTKVISVSEHKRLSAFNDYTAVMAVFDVKKQSLKRLPLFRAKNMDSTFLPSYAGFVGIDTFFVFGERTVLGRKKIRMGKVEVDDD